MREETVRFVNHVVWEADGKLATLLSAPLLVHRRPPGRPVRRSRPERAGVSAGLARSGPAGRHRDPGEPAGGVLAGRSRPRPSSAAPGSARACCARSCRCRRTRCRRLPELKQGLSNRQRAEQHTSDANLQLLPQADRWPGLRLRAVRRPRSRAHHGSAGVPVDTSGEVTDTHRHQRQVQRRRGAGQAARAQRTGARLRADAVAALRPGSARGCGGRLLAPAAQALVRGVGRQPEGDVACGDADRRVSPLPEA